MGNSIVMPVPHVIPGLTGGLNSTNTKRSALMKARFHKSRPHAVNHFHLAIL